MQTKRKHTADEAKGLGKTNSPGIKANQRISNLIKQAFNKSKKKNSLSSIVIRLTLMNDALSLLNNASNKIPELSKKETLDQCWNILVDYFAFVKDNYDLAHLQELYILTQACKNYYKNLDKNDQEELQRWQSICLKSQAETKPEPFLPEKKLNASIKAKDEILLSGPQKTKKEKLKESHKVKPYSKAGPGKKPKQKKISWQSIYDKIMAYPRNDLQSQEVDTFLKKISKKDKRAKSYALKMFNLYTHILKIKYNKVVFPADYKKFLIDLQKEFMEDIPEEKQHNHFAELIKKLKENEAKSHEKVDVNITLPTEAMLLHPSHRNFPKSEFGVTGDSSRRLIHGLTGIVKATEEEKLNYKLVQHSSHAMENKQRDHEKVKIDAGRPLSLDQLDILAKELDISLTADSFGDILVNKHTVGAVLDSADLARNAVKQSMENKAPSIALLRPPGHHAGEIDISELSDIKKAEGFCFLNNVFLAAQQASTLGAKNILLIDFDTHDGNGTKKLLENTWDCASNIYFVNTYSQHIYPHASKSEKKSASQNIFIPKSHMDKLIGIFDHPFPGQIKSQRAGDNEVLEAIEESLKKFSASPIDCILISCGLDAHEEDDLGQESNGGIALTDNFYKQIVEKVQSYFPGAPLNIFLEGGYNVKVIERVFEKLLLHLANQKKLNTQPTLNPHTFFAKKESPVSTPTTLTVNPKKLNGHDT